MNLDAITTMIKSHEGYREHPYKCTEGFWTVGYGHNIHNSNIATYAPHRSVGNLLDRLCNRELHSDWLQSDIENAIVDAQKFVGEAFDTLSSEQQDVLVCLAFQLGLPRLWGFVLFKQAIIDGDYVQAKAEMLDSRAARQTPQRWKELADRFLSD